MMDDIKSSMVVCRRCRRPLNRLEPIQATAEEIWIHPTQDHADHRPEPVSAATTGGEVVGTCDFCSATGPMWVYPCRSFVLDNHGFKGPWAACTTCAGYIDNEDLYRLVERCVASSPVTVRTRLRPHIQRLHRAFFAARRGPAIATF